MSRVTRSFAPTPLDLRDVPGCSAGLEGTLFVVRGDLRVLRADAHIVPTDSRASVTSAWSWLWEPGQPQRRRVLAAHREALERDRASVVRPRSGRVVVATNIAVTSETDPLDWLADGVRAALHSYGAWLHADHKRRDGLRGLPLLAMPVLGTQRGGLAGRRGAVVKVILDIIQKYQSQTHGGEAAFDVVLVCRKPSDYAAIQSERLRRIHGSSPEWLRPIERSAATGQLGVMFGAGASVSLGLPTWSALLDRLAADLRADSREAHRLHSLDPVDAASLLVDLAAANRLSFKAAIRRHVTTDECSLTHALIANIGPALAVTTNYDAGYENAVRAMDEESPAVLPWEQPTSRHQARLLKLHGDVTRGSIVLSRDDFVTMNAHRRPLGSMLQERMMVGHLLTVGSTMSDPTLVLAAEEVSSLLRSTSGSRLRNGTVVLTQDDPARRGLLARSFDVVVADGGNVPAVTASRRVEILLDRLAMKSGKGVGYLLDEAYDDLVRPGERRTVSLLRELSATAPAGPMGKAVRQALAELGRYSG